KINPDYPNTHYALALTSNLGGGGQKAFSPAFKGLGLNPKREGVYDNGFKIAIERAQKLTQSIQGEKTVEEFATQLEKAGDKTIKVEIDEEIPTAAKIEFSENYNRNYHLVKYKSSYPAVEHLVMHELMHLELATEARASHVNQLFITNHYLK